MAPFAGGTGLMGNDQFHHCRMLEQGRIEFNELPDQGRGFLNRKLELEQAFLGFSKGK